MDLFFLYSIYSENEDTGIYGVFFNSLDFKPIIIYNRTIDEYTKKELNDIIRNFTFNFKNIFYFAPSELEKIAFDIMMEEPLPNNYNLSWLFNFIKYENSYINNLNNMILFFSKNKINHE